MSLHNNTQWVNFINSDYDHNCERKLAHLLASVDCALILQSIDSYHHHLRFYCLRILISDHTHDDARNIIINYVELSSPYNPLVSYTQIFRLRVLMNTADDCRYCLRIHRYRDDARKQYRKRKYEGRNEDIVRPRRRKNKAPYERTYVHTHMARQTSTNSRSVCTNMTRLTKRPKNAYNIQNKTLPPSSLVTNNYTQTIKNKLCPKNCLCFTCNKRSEKRERQYKDKTASKERQRDRERRYGR
jgi:hypothetical protein